MSRKRRVFDVDLPEDDFPAGKAEPQSEPAPAAPDAGDEIPPDIETKSMVQRRRGPMATAIGETGDALRVRQRIEADIRAENDRLAHEFVRLKKAGLVTDMVPLERIRTTKLTRDRNPAADLELDELKASLRELGLSNPIRVEEAPGGDYELIEGYRRLTAFRELLVETGDPRWMEIPVGLVAAGQGAGALYRRMVDENLVRKDISFAEMAALALSYAEEHVDDCDDLDDAVNRLYASVGPQKRSYIRRFAQLLRRIGKQLEHPAAISRALGLKVLDALEADPASIGVLSGMLQDAPRRDAEAEGAILRTFAESRAASVPPKTRGAPRADRRGRVVLSVPVGPGVRCTAADGKMEMRAAVDFSSLDRSRLERAIAAFFAELDGDGPRGR